MDAASAAIRPARDADADAIIALIEDAWSDYPGLVLHVDDELPELRALASHYAANGGALWAAEADGRLMGIVAAVPGPSETWEVGKLYVDRDLRGAGLAHTLLDTAEAYARAAGARRMELWSDTRLVGAHAFYEKRGYLRGGPIRPLDDRSHSLEFHFAKPLAGLSVEVLGVGAAASAERPLAAILCACVDAGASVSFLPPLERETARGFWRKLAVEVARGTRILLAAWLDGVLVGTVTLDLATPPNQPHRADLQKLLVTPALRRRGVARALVLAAEEQAAQAGRSLLTLDTCSDSAAVPLYRNLGYTEAGRIPGYAVYGDGRPCDTLIFWKRLG